MTVWFQDEMRAGLQGTLTRIWAKKGTRPTAPKQTEYEWLYVFGAVCPETGEISGLLLPDANTDAMNLFLETLSLQVGTDRYGVLVLDQAGWHQSRGLRIPENLELVFLPPYSPELNPAERLWEEFRQELSNWVFKTYDDLLHAVSGVWNLFRNNPHAIQSLTHNFYLNSLS